MKIHFKSLIKLIIVISVLLFIDSTSRAAEITPDETVTVVQEGSWYYDLGSQLTQVSNSGTLTGDIPFYANDYIFSGFNQSAVVHRNINIFADSSNDNHSDIFINYDVTQYNGNSGEAHQVDVLGIFEFQITSIAGGSYNIVWDLGNTATGRGLCYYTISTTSDGVIYDQTLEFNTIDDYRYNVTIGAGETISIRLNVSQMTNVSVINSAGTVNSHMDLLVAYGTATPSPTPTNTPIPPTPAAGEDTAGTANSGNQVTIIGKLTQLVSDIASLPGRIATAIGGFFTGLGNSIVGALEDLLQGILDGLEYLFIPDDFSGLIESNLEDLKDSMGILYIPIDLIERIFRVLTWHGSASLSFDGYTLPGYSDPVVPAFSYTFTLSDYLGSTYANIISMILCASLIYLSAKTTLNHIFGTDVPDPINEGDED